MVRGGTLSWFCGPILKIFLYFLSGLFVLPAALFAIAFVILGQAIAQQSLFDFFFLLLARAYQLLTWGIWFILSLLVGWCALGFLDRYRYLGAMATVLAALLALIELAFAAKASGGGGLLLPGGATLGLAIAAWLAWDGWSVAVGT